MQFNHFVNSELAFVITVVNLKTAILTQRKKNQIRFTLYCFYIIIYLSKNPVISSGDDFDQCSWCAGDQNKEVCHREVEKKEIG